LYKLYVTKSTEGELKVRTQVRFIDVIPKDWDSKEHVTLTNLDKKTKSHNEEHLSNEPMRKQSRASHDKTNENITEETHDQTNQSEQDTNTGSIRR